MFEVNGKIALITGAARGIGFNFAKELLKNGLKGVSLLDIDVVQGEKAVAILRKDFGPDCVIFIHTDVSDETQFEEAFKTTVEKFKQLDIVINNAGFIQEIQWHKCVAVNLMGTISGSYLAMEKYLPKFKSGNEGIIINVASVLGFNHIEEVPVYVATKSGLIGFSRSIGGPVHYEKYKVRVLTVCPGVTDTSMMIGLTAEQQHEPFRSMMNELLPTLQQQRPEDVAQNLTKIIETAPSASVWTVIKGIWVQMELPKVEE